MAAVFGDPNAVLDLRRFVIKISVVDGGLG